MELQAVTFTAPGRVALQSRTIPDEPSDDEILLETEASIVSAGTELAILAGIEDWAPLPFVPGYGAVGVARRVGRAVQGCKPGDRLVTYGPHQSASMIRGFFVQVPDGLAPSVAAFARLAEVAYTAVRVSSAELGDTVAVIGLGVVGNLAAQLMTLAGCEVIGIELSARRCEIARACGVAHTVCAAEDEPQQAVRAITGGAMCNVVVEATGVPALAQTAASLAGPLGEVVLLGTPRGPFVGDPVALLRSIHLAPSCVTFKGAHEWRYPATCNPGVGTKHSIERNVKQALGLLQSGRLRVRELLTHRVPPGRCAEMYAALQAHSPDHLGVVFDWRDLESACG